MATPAELWSRLPWWTKRFLTLLDIYVNWRLGGTWGETISERLALSRRRGERAGQIGCSILDRFDPGHCERALAGDFDEGMS